MTDEEIETYVDTIVACPTECLAYQLCEQEHALGNNVDCVVIVKKYLLTQDN